MTVEFRHTLFGIELDIRADVAEYVPAIVGDSPEKCSPAHGGDCVSLRAFVGNVDIEPLLSGLAYSRLEAIAEDIAAGRQRGYYTCHTPA